MWMKVQSRFPKEDTDHNITPLVEFDWQVSVRLDPFSIGRIHH